MSKWPGLHRPLRPVAARYRYIASGFCFVLALAASVAQAAETGRDLFNLPLEELLNIEVTSASQSKHKINVAPGVISVVKASELMAMGARTLSDALKMLPGVQMQNQRSGLESVWLRGIRTGRNTKVLLLIDGVPQDEVIFGEWSPDESIPLNNIERIELLRGPGSALYGGNAYAGVISVFTKSSNIGGSIVSAGYAEYNSRRATFETAQEWDQSRLLLSGNAYKSTGYPVDFDRQGKPSTHDNNVSDYGLSAKFLAGEWTALLSVNEYTAEYPYYSSAQYKAQEYLKGNLSLHHLHPLEHAELDNQIYVHSVNRRYDRKIDNAIGVRTFSSYSDLDSVLSGVRSQYRYHFTTAHELALGASYQSRVVNEFHETVTLRNGVPTHEFESIILRNGDRTPSAHNYALWLQQESTFLAGQLLLTAGLRYDHYPQFSAHTSPRFALTYDPDGPWSGKLLWGKAFRPPTLEEQYEVRNDGNIAGNPELTPELIDTREAELNYRFSADANLTLRAFRSELTDFISQSGLAPFTNTGQETIPGYELEWTNQRWLDWWPGTKLSWSANYTRVDTGLGGVAKNNANITAFFDHASYGWYIGVNYLGQRNGSDTYHDLVTEPAQRDRNNLGAYFIIDSSFRLKELGGSNWALALLVHNLFDRRYYNPTSEPDAYYDVKKEPRNVELQASYRF